VCTQTRMTSPLIKNYKIIRGWGKDQGGTERNNNEGENPENSQKLEQIAPAEVKRTLDDERPNREGNLSKSSF